jgi:thiol-disulfide isomerase/thioredoxin
MMRKALCFNNYFMKYFIAICCIFFLSAISANVNAQPGSLKIGDKIPAIVFRKSINYKTISIKLSDFRGKVLLLDFWETTCAPCIRNFPKLDSLQKKFRDQLVILPITDESAERTRQFFRRASMKGLSLSSVVEDKISGIYFPHRVIPHCALINADGIVVAVTLPEYIDESVIGDVIHKTVIHLPVKTDNLAFDGSKSLFIDGNGGTGSPFFYRSLVSGHVAGLSSSFARTKLDSLRKGISYRNIPIAQLYLNAYERPLWYWVSRMYFEGVADTTKYYRSPALNKRSLIEWGQKNTYCYDLVVPSACTDSAMQNIMADDLNRAFGALYNLKVFIGKRNLDCWQLIVSKNDRLAAVIKQDTIGAPHNYTVADKEQSVYEYQSPDDLAMRLEGILKIPVANKTEQAFHIDLILPDEVINKARHGDISRLQEILAAKGLTLIPGQSEFEALVFKEN